MAIQETIVSDISGREGASSVRVGLEGEWVTLDLTGDELKALSDYLAPYLRAGRKVRDKVPSARRVPKMSAAKRAEIREWASQNGYTVAMRGQIPIAVVRAYREQADDVAEDPAA